MERIKERDLKKKRIRDDIFKEAYKEFFENEIREIQYFYKDSPINDKDLVIEVFKELEGQGTIKGLILGQYSSNFVKYYPSDRLFINYEKENSLHNLRNEYGIILENQLAIRVYQEPINEDFSSEAIQEVKIFSRFSHPNIVKYRNSFTFSYKNATYLGIIEDWIEGGTLKTKFDIIRNQQFEIKIKYIHGLVDALLYLNKNLEQHTDLHEENILVTPSKFVIIDIGQPSHDPFSIYSISAYNKKMILSICKRIFSQKEHNQCNFDSLRTNDNLTEWMAFISNILFPNIPDEQNLNHRFEIFTDFLQRTIIYQTINTKDPLFHEFLNYVLIDEKFHKELNLHFECNDEHLTKYRFNPDYYSLANLEFDEILFSINCEFSEYSISIYKKKNSNSLGAKISQNYNKILFNNLVDGSRFNYNLVMKYREILYQFINDILENRKTVKLFNERVKKIKLEVELLNILDKIANNKAKFEDIKKKIDYNYDLITYLSFLRNMAFTGDSDKILFKFSNFDGKIHKNYEWQLDTNTNEVLSNGNHVNELENGRKLIKNRF